ncbi:MAG: hypothetical protein EOP45_12335 [Sphingobacteriaceae bacterium]|nr:MAG: hypothetical protein EOP45_12335 [Sphingobacteriaceae bacterium]
MEKYRGRCALPSPAFRGKCIHRRLRILAHVQWLPKWTSLAADAKDINLKFYWHDEREIPENWISWMPEHRKENCRLLLKDSPNSAMPKLATTQEHVIDLTSE